jgi:hypothetical protein
MKFCPVVPAICCGQVHGPRKERKKEKKNNNNNINNNNYLSLTNNVWRLIVFAPFLIIIIIIIIIINIIIIILLLFLSFIHLEVININVRNFKFPIGFYSNPHPLWTPQNMTLTPFTTNLKTLGPTRNIYLVTMQSVHLNLLSLASLGDFIIIRL